MNDMMLFLTIAAVAMAVVVGFAVGAILVERSWRKRIGKNRPAYTQDLTRFADPVDYWSQLENEDTPRTRSGRGRSLGKRKD